jgi:DNA replication protein DnaC
MALKQVDAAENASEVVNGITGIFQAMELPRLANPDIYLGIPLPILEDFHQALHEQRSGDEKKRFLSRLRYAGILKERSADTFKWDADTYPLAEPGMIERALGLEFAKQCKGLVVAGPPGVGKTLLVNIIACKAIWAGFSLMYKTAHDIATELSEATTENILSRYIKKLQARDILIIEDVTFATFDERAAQAFFSIMDKRYGRKITVITANGNINEWAGNFPDKSMSSAILGRFYEDAWVVNMNGAIDMRLSKAKGMLGSVCHSAAIAEGVAPDG